MADVTRQPRSERSVEMDVVSPVVLGFLRTRLPLAMAVRKRQLDALDPERRAELMKLYAESVGRGNDLAQQSMIGGDTSVREIRAESGSAQSLAGQVRTAQGAENVAKTRAETDLSMQKRDQDFRVWVSGVVTVPEQQAIDERMSKIGGMLKNDALAFDARLDNAFNEAKGSFGVVVAGTDNNLHKGAILDQAVKAMRQSIGYESLPPADKVKFNAKVAELYGEVGVPTTVIGDGNPVSSAGLEAYERQSVIEGDTPRRFYSGGGANVAQTGEFAVLPTQGTAATVPAPGAGPAGVPSTAGGVVVPAQAGAPVVGVAQGAPGYRMVRLANGAYIPSPEYGYGGYSPAMQAQLARERALQGVLLDEMGAYDRERAEAMKSGADQRVSLDLFDARPNKSQAAVDAFGERYGRMSPVDREAANARLTEILRQLKPAGEERRDLRTEDRAMGMVSGADTELVGDRAAMESGDPLAFRVGAAGTMSERVQEAAKKLNDARARIEVGIQQNELGRDAAMAAMAPWYKSVGDVAMGMDEAERKMLIESLSGPEGVRMGATTVINKRLADKAKVDAFYTGDDAAEADKKTEAAIDKYAEKALGEEYAKTEADKPQGPSREETLAEEPPALPTKPMVPVKGETFDVTTPGTAAPTAKAKVDAFGAGADVVSGPYQSVPRDTVFSPGRDLGDQAAYIGLKRVYVHTTGKDPDDPENAEDYQTFVSERMKNRKSKKETPDATQP